MPNTGPVQVAPHDRTALAAAVTAITGQPTQVGDTRLEFLATLTPATSGGVDFLLWEDGHVEEMSTACPACGTTTHGPAVTGDTARDRYTRLHRLATTPRRPLLARLTRRLVGCRTCAPQTLLGIEVRS